MEKNLIISIRRHEERQKDKTGKKLINLTEEAIKRSRFYGSLIRDLIPVGCVWGYHSKAPRAEQTLKEILNGVIKQEERKFFPIEERMFYSPLLDEPDWTDNPEYTKAKNQAGQNYDDRVNFLLQNPDPTGKVESMESCGKRIVKHIRNIRKEGGFKGQVFEGQVENVTHGPLVEAGLIQLIDPTIKDIKYLHGGFREGESFTVEFIKKWPYRPISDDEVYVHFRGEKIKVDL